MKSAVTALGAFFLAAVAVLGPAPAAQAETIVFAAASTTEAINEIDTAFMADGKGTAKASFGSSSTLAKQIESGAPAAVFLSADEQWMDYLDQKKLIAAGTRSDLLGNELVLVAPKSAGAQKIDIQPGMPLAKMLGDGRLALGDPTHVPAGLYAKAALEKLGLWDQVQDKIAAGQDVRAALAYVERGEAPLGIVYATDAAASDKVQVVGVFPASSHPPILYPVGLVAGHDTPEAKEFLDYLKGAKAKAIFEKYGFRTGASVD